MKRSQFSEDQYEDAVIHEIKQKNKGYHLHFKPDRNLEKILGFDLALFREGMGGFVNSFLLDKAIVAPKAKVPTNCLVNCFIQCKIPVLHESTTRSRSSKWESWKEFYFEYKIDIDQNKTLVEFENKLSAKGVIFYSSPCFTTWESLRQVESNLTVLKASNMVPPSKLAGHKSFTYQKSTRGIGHSFPEDIDSIIGIWKSIKEIRKNNKPKQFHEMIEDLFSIINSIDRDFAIHRFEYLALDMSSKRVAQSISRTLMNELGSIDYLDILRMYYSIIGWCRKNDLNWIIL